MLEIILTIDIDADVFDESLKANADQGQQPTWKGAEAGIPLLSNLFKKYSGSDNKPCVATWFIRADDQVGHYYEDRAYVYTKFQKDWNSLAQNGHELAWHPHLYKQEKGVWTQETNPEALTIQMTASLEALKNKGLTITSSRIGEAYFSNSILQSLAALGILCDSTALPGRERKDESRSIDWLITPTLPYYPYVQDYRVPGTPQVNILEVPFSMIEVLADYDTVPLKRYIDLSFWHHTLKDGLEQAIENNSILNCIVHPSSIIPELAAKSHGLLSYSLKEVKKNIDFIIATANRKGIDYRFKTMSQLYNRIIHEQPH